MLYITQGYLKIIRQEKKSKTHLQHSTHAEGA